MKRLIIAAVLLLTCFLTTLAFEKRAEAVISEIVTALSECENGEDREKLYDAINAWEKNKKYLFLITKSDDFLTADNGFIRLEVLAERGEFSACLSVCGEISLIFSDFSAQYNITVENIF